MTGLEYFNICDTNSLANNSLHTSRNQFSIGSNLVASGQECTRPAARMNVLDRFRNVVNFWPALIGVVHTNPTNTEKCLVFKLFAIVFLLIVFLLPGAYLYTILECNGDLVIKTIATFGTMWKVC